MRWQRNVRSSPFISWYGTHSLLYAAEREPFPTLSLHWRMPRSHSISAWTTICRPAHRTIRRSWWWTMRSPFAAGQDVTIRRWDTAAHRARRSAPDRPRRRALRSVPRRSGGRRPRGRSRACAIGARALERTVPVSTRRRFVRWAIPGRRPWTPDLTEIDVGIARTHPASEEQDEIRECEALFFDSVDRAERTIFIENQFLTAASFAHRLATAHAGKAKARGRHRCAQDRPLLDRAADNACRSRSLHACVRRCRSERARGLAPSPGQRRRTARSKS